MYSLLLTIFGVACVLHSGQACFYCEPNETELSDAYCYPYKHVFLIQAEVVAETGPLLNLNGLEKMTEEEKEQAMDEYGFMRYTMAVKKVYRDDGADILQTIALDAETNTTNCGTRLTLGKTYVLSGYFYTVDGNMVLETDACEYVREYDTEVEVLLPECPESKKRSLGKRGPILVDTRKDLNAMDLRSLGKDCHRFGCP